MGKVKTLREDVYRKIAAGEVVERPLSVVKELVENSLDAGADNIKIDIIDGGKQSIKIEDNGSGIASEDIKTAFQKHSTSKITELSDFDTLGTLGFRGEALPSILEVSKIQLKTSNNNDGAGIYCEFENGQLIQKEGIAFSRGTTIVAKDLFYNFPVRKKFLKTERTELNQIISFLEPISLYHFNKSFELTHNNKTVFQYRKTSDLSERVYQVFGKDFLDSLQSLQYSEGNYQINGLISKLNTGISVKKHQYYFVNGRSIRERTLIAALNNTFDKFLEKSRYPVSILMMTIPPNEVDVNIHPMKLEIKFENSSSIYQLVKHAIEHTFGMNQPYDINMNFTAVPSSGNSFSYHEKSNTDAMRRSSGSGYYNQTWQNSYPTNPTHENTHTNFQAQKPLAPYSQTQLFPNGFKSEEDFHIIGQYKNSYILVEKNNDLLLIDQHNAQERVNFDQLKEEYQTDNVNSLSPLFPIIIELTPSEIAGLDDSKLKLLEKIGFRIEAMGGNTYDIKGFPQILGEKNISDALRKIIHLDVTSKEDAANFEDQILAEIACKSAIKVNHKLFPDQMNTIVKNLFKTSNPYFCPHKRPIIIEFTLEQIEKMLKRK